MNGSQIVAEQWSDKLIVYLYDATGAPMGMMYRTTAYAEEQWDVFWFEKNLQGDIVAVYNSEGNNVVTYYYYNAWGNHMVSYTNGGNSTGAQYNPFRYRGYYYDTDLGMYYLQSRYYDARIGRFINADGYVSTGQGLTGNNMFAYCGNNPVNRVDPTGEIWSLVINLFKIIKSNVIVANNDTPAMGEEFDNYTDSEAPTYGMTIDEKMAYIRRIRLNNDTIKDNWSEAAMLREMEYHETGYRIAVFFGSDPKKEKSLADRLEHVDFEKEQNFITYFRRFYGNLLPWGVN